MTNDKADLSSTEALRRQLYGSGSERKARLLEKLQLEELEAAALRRSHGLGLGSRPVGRQFVFACTAYPHPSML